MKPRKLLSYSESNGSFLARIPGFEKSQTWPSTIAYVAQLMIHRYAMLGILTEDGYPLTSVGILDVPAAESQSTGERTPLAGKKCPSVGTRR
jgi:ribonucleoside-diphosphate reductase alpha chain